MTSLRQDEDCLPYNRKCFELLPTKFSQEGPRCVELTKKNINSNNNNNNNNQFNEYLLTGRLNSTEIQSKAIQIHKSDTLNKHNKNNNNNIK